MRLSTDPDRDEARGTAVLHAALDSGITVLDTADAYCLDDSERGHNERLIARMQQKRAAGRRADDTSRRKTRDYLQEDYE